MDEEEYEHAIKERLLNLGITKVNRNGQIIFQQNAIGMPTREETTCNIGHVDNVQLKQEVDNQ